MSLHNQLEKYVKLKSVVCCGHENQIARFTQHNSCFEKFQWFPQQLICGGVNIEKGSAKNIFLDAF